jgi:hypothetical protein
MATRFYLPSSGAAAISPAYTAGWEDQTIAARLPTSTTKASSAMTTVSFTDANAANRDVLFRQYVSAPLAGQYIAAQAMKIQMRVKQRAADCNLFLTWNIKVVSNDGTVVRGTVVNMRRDTTEAEPTAITNRQDTLTSTAVTAHSGDRLVIEVGLGGDPATGSDHDSDMSIGDDNGTDLPENNSATAANNPWVQFTNDLTFYTAGDIIVHEKTEDTQTAVSSITMAHTVSANLSNTGLLVHVHIYDPTEADRNITSVTYNGEALSKLKDFDVGGDGVNDEYWFRASPTTGTHDVVATAAGTCSEFSLNAVTLGNVLSTQPDTNTGGETDTTTATPSLSVTSTVDRAFLFSSCSAYDNGGVYVTGAGQVELFNYVVGYVSDGYSGPKTPAGAITHTWSNDTTDTFGLVGVVIKPYVAAGGPTNLKTWNSLAKASIKTINGLIIASTKTVNSLT